MGKITWTTPFLKQLWCMSSLLMCQTCQGMLLGFTTSLLPALHAPDSPIPIDLDSGSWLASCLGPSLLVGTTCVSLLLSWCGRRGTYLLVIIPGATGWIMIYLAQSYIVLLIGRILTSFTAGAVHTLGVVVIGEYTSPQHRGMFLNLKTAAYCLGNTIVHLMGNFLHWRTTAILITIPFIFFFLVGWTWPESPSWLASKKRFDECEESFFWLRGISEESMREVTELIKSQNEMLSMPKRKISLLRKVGNFLRKFTRKDFVKPLWVITIGIILMETSGRHIFPTYALQIVSDALDTDTSAYYYTLAIDLIITISSVFSSVLVRTMKRRTLLFSTGIATFLCLIATSLYLYFMSVDMVPKEQRWVIVCLFIAFFSLTNLGCAPIALTMQGELIPLAHRESVSAVLGLILSIILTCTLKIFPYLLIWIKIYGAFAVLGAFMGLSLLILYFILPETKDRTLQDIENYFNGRIRSGENGDDDVHLKMVDKDDA